MVTIPVWAILVFLVVVVAVVMFAVKRWRLSEVREEMILAIAAFHSCKISFGTTVVHGGELITRITIIGINQVMWISPLQTKLLVWGHNTDGTPTPVVIDFTNPKAPYHTVNRFNPDLLGAMKRRVLELGGIVCAWSEFDERIEVYVHGITFTSESLVTRGIKVTVEREAMMVTPHEHYVVDKAGHADEVSSELVPTSAPAS